MTVYLPIHLAAKTMNCRPVSTPIAKKIKETPMGKEENVTKMRHMANAQADKRKQIAGIRAEIAKNIYEELVSVESISRERDYRKG